MIDLFFFKFDAILHKSSMKNCINYMKIIGVILPQNALKRDCNGKCIEWIEGHYLEVVVLL